MTVSEVTSPDSLAALLAGHLHREHPFRPTHVMAEGEHDLRSRSLSPLFRGSFDWHSSVHSHWALARLLVVTDDKCPIARDALEISFTAERVSGELDQLDRPHRRGFELPYGMAWLLCLVAELDAAPAWASSWAARLEPLGELARRRFWRWLEQIPGPIRSGQHAQSAFAMSLALDAARVRGDDELEALIAARAREFYALDRDAPIDWEPSAYDFLSPSLAEADLMRRVLGSSFPAWLDAFLPTISLTPTGSVDPSDGKLAHADGLSLSRAWMLAALAEHRPALAELAAAHRHHGIASLATASYAGTHWLPSFLVYLLHGTARPS